MIEYDPNPIRMILREEMDVLMTEAREMIAAAAQAQIEIDRQRAAISVSPWIEPEPENERASIATREAAQASRADVATVLTDCLLLMHHAAEPYGGKFPSHPKPSPEWWAELKRQIDALAPRLVKHIEECDA